METSSGKALHHGEGGHGVRVPHCGDRAIVAARNVRDGRQEVVEPVGE